MSARDHSAGRAIVEEAEKCRLSGSSVELLLRARSEPISVHRFNLNQFTVRLYTEGGAFYDVAYSAIEAAKCKRAKPADATDW